MTKATINRQVARQESKITELRVLASMFARPNPTLAASLSNAEIVLTKLQALANGR